MTMSSIIKTLCLALSLTLAPVAVSTVHAETATPAVVKPDMKRVQAHLKDHQTYPATRAELLASCQGLMEFNDGEKAWFAAHLPEGTYNSSAEVLKALRSK
jgi:hypothetical protein